MSVWKLTANSQLPHGESVLCWDAINKVMFVAYRSGDDLIPEPYLKGEPTRYQADYWRPLPAPPK